MNNYLPKIYYMLGTIIGTLFNLHNFGNIQSFIDEDTDAQRTYVCATIQ